MGSECCIRTQERQQKSSGQLSTDFSYVKKNMEHIISQEMISHLDSMSNHVLTTSEYGFPKNCHVKLTVIFYSRRNSSLPWQRWSNWFNNHGIFESFRFGSAPAPPKETALICHTWLTQWLKRRTQSVVVDGRVQLPAGITRPVLSGVPRTGADPGFFLGGGALVSCSTSTPINHIVFFFVEYQLY